MRYTVKIKIDKENFYQHWSSLVDAPVTYILSESDWKLFYKNQYGISAFEEWKFGCRRNGDFNKSLKLYNSKHEIVNKKEFISKYKINYTKDLLIITTDKIRPAKYVYKGKIYEALLTTFHKELEKDLIICKTDTGYTYLDFSIFLTPSNIQLLYYMPF